MDYIGIIKKRKIVDGKLYRSHFISRKETEVGIPAGVTMTTTTGNHYVTNKSLAMRFPGTDIFYFPYKDRESQENALLRMIDLVGKLTEGRNVTATNTRERKSTTANYDNVDTPNGINLFLTNRDRIVLSVSYFDFGKLKFCTKNMHCGTVDNWKQKYPEKLQQAIMLRNRSLEIYGNITTSARTY
jgi:hypothetical protein